MPILEIYPEKRATAKEMLGHYWLDMTSKDFFVKPEDVDPKVYDNEVKDITNF